MASGSKPVNEGPGSSPVLGDGAFVPSADRDPGPFRAYHRADRTSENLAIESRFEGFGLQNSGSGAISIGRDVYFGTNGL
jgi:hypothetical protein